MEKINGGEVDNPWWEPEWDWYNFEYRVKPESTYRQYKNIKEMLEDIAKELIMDAVKRGFMSHEEIKKQVDEAEEFLKDIEKVLDDVQKGIGINE